METLAGLFVVVELKRFGWASELLLKDVTSVFASLTVASTVGPTVDPTVFRSLSRYEDPAALLVPRQRQLSPV